MGAGTLFTKMRASNPNDWETFRQSGLRLKAKNRDDLELWQKFVETHITDAPIPPNLSPAQKRESYVLIVRSYWDFLKPVVSLPATTDISVARHPSHHDRTILQVAARSGYTHFIADRFSQCKPSDINREDYPTRCGILYLAEASSSRKTLELLLANGANPKATGFQDRTALHQALRDGRDHLVPAFEAYFPTLRTLADETNDTPDGLLSKLGTTLEAICKKQKAIAPSPATQLSCGAEVSKVEGKRPGPSQVF